MASRKMFYLIFIVVLVSGIMLLIGCEGNGGSDLLKTAFNILGKLGDTYNFYYSKDINNRDTSSYDVDKICIMPAERAQEGICYIADILDNVTFVDINEDGTFTIPVPETDDTFNWAYLLINSQNSKVDQIVGYISLNSGVNDSLLSLPTADVTDDVDYGEINQVGDEAMSSNEISDVQSSFNLSLSTLQEIAKRDNILKCVKNNYINYDKDTGIGYMVYTRLNWKASNAGIDTDFLDPASFNYQGYYPQIETNDQDITPEKIVNGTTLIKVYPPSGVTILAGDTGGDETYDSTNPFTSEGCQYSDPTDKDSYTYNPDAPEFGVIGLEPGTSAFMFRPYSGSGELYFPDKYDGYWSVTKSINGGTESQIATFDLSLALPVDDSGRCIVYTPSIKVSHDDANKLTEIELKFYSYDSSSDTFVEVTDIDAITQIVGKYMLGVLDTPTGDYYFDASITDSGVQLIFDSDSEDREGNKLSTIDFNTNNTYQIYYNMGGVNFNFWISGDTN